ncbi:hypothetical protein HDU76_009797 [Blyttiomyces sp. JEL0837]|nr:hypothetical protein HDU76_009797 [Blyttiomyces sp. JEL0837]
MHPTFRFPDYLLPHILPYVANDLQTISQARMVSQNWMAASTALLFRKITLKFDTDHNGAEIDLHNMFPDGKFKDSDTLLPKPFPYWSKYIHYVQINAPKEPVQMFAVIKWCSKLFNTLGEFENLKGLICEEEFFPGLRNDIDGGLINKANSLTMLSLFPYTGNIPFLLPPSAVMRLSRNDEIMALNGLFATKCLTVAEPFKNVQILNVNAFVFGSVALDYTGLKNFNNLKTVIIDTIYRPANIYPNMLSWDVFMNMVTNLPISVRALALYICDFDIIYLGKLGFTVPVVNRLQAHLQEIDIKISIFRSHPDMEPFGIGLSCLFQVLPVSVQIMRFEAEKMCLVYEDSTNRIHLESCLPTITNVFSSHNWMNRTDSKLQGDDCDSIVHLHLANYKLSTLIDLSTHFFENLESLSVESLLEGIDEVALGVLQKMKNLFHLSIVLYIDNIELPADQMMSVCKSLRAGCLGLSRVLIHTRCYGDNSEERFSSFNSLMESFVGDKGLSNSVKRLWVTGANGGIDFNANWVKVSEERGIIVEPFYDPFVGIRYPKSINDLANTGPEMDTQRSRARNDVEEETYSLKNLNEKLNILEDAQTCNNQLVTSLKESIAQVSKTTEDNSRLVKDLTRRVDAVRTESRRQDQVVQVAVKVAEESLQQVHEDLAEISMSANEKDREYEERLDAIVDEYNLLSKIIGELPTVEVIDAKVGDLERRMDDAVQGLELKMENIKKRMDFGRFGEGIGTISAEK